MNLLELNFKIDSNLVEALDLYMRRIGACGISFEDPSDALNIIKAQESGEEDASIFFDPSFIDDLSDEAEVKVWFKRESKEIKESIADEYVDYDLDEGLDEDLNEDLNEDLRLKKALPSTSAIYIYEVAKDLIDDDTNEVCVAEKALENSQNSENSNISNDNPYYVDREVLIEDINSEIKLEKFFPKAGGNEYCDEVHSVEEFQSIFSKHLKDFFNFFFIEAVDLDSIKYKEIEEKDWLEAYKEHYGIVRISDKIIICPSWKKYDNREGEIVINLDPESAFGTGMHASTAMCARFIEAFIKDDYKDRLELAIRNLNILDLGTGSGILAIIAEKLIAKNFLVVNSSDEKALNIKIDACDIDSNAIRVAEENCVKNNCNSINAFVGSIDSIDEKYNLIIANLISDLQLKFASEYTKVLSENGILIVSGIINERADEVVEKFKQNGLEIVDMKSENGWIALLCKNLA